MMRKTALVCFLAATAAAGIASAAAPARERNRPPAGDRPAAARPAAGQPASDLFASLAWREIGPYRGGRSAAVTGVPSQPEVYYFGATGGGVWKTEDAGRRWKNVSDGFFGGSIGAVAVAPSDPTVVYVGTGEKTVRGNVSHGDGLWRSLDAGRTWQFMGLGDSRHIPRIRVHPRDPRTLYVAALGHLFGPNDERGVFRSNDGGQSWRRVLFTNRDAGAIDLALDPSNPRVVYASTWRVRRTPWSLESGGEGSALWKSVDGGETWKELTRNVGMPGVVKDGPPNAPRPVLGIIGITVSPSNPNNLYALVEAEEGGLFRSRDGGDTWLRVNESRELRQRAWYYTRVVADPADEDVVYVLNVDFLKSKDGGKTFSEIDVPHGDNHDLWIAPDAPQRMIQSNDGGANVSNDGGRSWSTQSNQPTAQIYRLSTDTAFPFHVLGAQQDNSALRIQHRSAGDSIDADAWEETAGGESGHIVASPQDPELVFGGSYGGYLTMLNHRTGEFRDVNAWPDNPMGHGAEGARYRFQWNYPLFFSPNEDETLYAAANVLFRSRDRGASWQAISPDLTRNDPSKLGPSGGPITKDNTSVEYYGTIFAVAESTLAPGTLWAGSDDGLVHVSTDGGGHWQKVSPTGLPEWAQINSIEASPFDKGGAYVAATRYKLDDFRPYLFKTVDFGKTWTRIDTGLPVDHFTRVLRADPKRKGLLYAGTERGVWVSFDDGATWRSLQLRAKRGGLPIVPVTDLALRDGILLAATQGRGVWALDDLAVLRQHDLAGRVRLFAPEPAWRFGLGSRGRAAVGSGTNPPGGVVVHYEISGLKEGTPLRLEFLDAQGTSLRRFEGEVKAARPAPDEVASVAMGDGAPPEASPAAADKADPKAEAKRDKDKKKETAKKDEPKVPGTPGMNRFAWNLRTEPAKTFEGLVLWAGAQFDGPTVVPGDYEVRLTAGDVTRSQRFVVLADPRSGVSAADLQAQYDFLAGVRDKLTQMHQAIEDIRRVRADFTALAARAGSEDKTKGLRTAIEAAQKTLTEIEEALYQTKNKSQQDPLNFPIRLNDKLALLARSVGTGSFPPTAQAIAVRNELVPKIDAELERWKAVESTTVPEIERLAREAEVPALSPDPPATGAS
jgi:photosystem II stability/assembly factor-like uncharacterized protein